MSDNSSSNNSSSKRFVTIALLLIGLAGIAVGGVAYQMHLGSQADEAAAKQVVTELGGLAVLDASQQHVGTLNLQLIKDESKVQKAMAQVSDLPHLQVLDASATLLSDDDLAAVAALSKLNSLHLNNTLLTDDGLQYLAPMQQLYGLHAAHTAITDKGLAQIAKLQGLVHLDLSGNRVGPGLAELKALPKLTWLLVQEVPLETPVLAALGELTQIKRLSIGEAESRPEVVKELKKRLPNVTID